MSDTWKAEIEKYPNLGNKTLPADVECAKQEKIIQTEKAFKRFCPQNFKIIKVSWVRSRKKPYCIWRVEYNLNGCALLPGEGDDLKNFNMLEKHHPLNTAIINIHRSSNAIIDYGVMCKCNAPNFEFAVQSPGQLPLDTLHENMANMKLIAVEEKGMYVAGLI